MSRKTSKAPLSIGIICLVVLIDQVVKVFVKTHLFYGQDIELLSWWHIRFIENNGMAFGWELGGKYFLTSFRLVAILVIGVYLFNMVRLRAKPFAIVCVSLIVAGAIGNVVDCLFYGLLFNSPGPPHVAQFVSAGEGYAPFMLGRVVDMLYFPLLEWDMPGWPWLGYLPLLPKEGEHCVFFSPIFNVADAAVSVGIIALLVSACLPARRHR